MRKGADGGEGFRAPLPLFRYVGDVTLDELLADFRGVLGSPFPTGGGAVDVAIQNASRSRATGVEGLVSLQIYDAQKRVSDVREKHLCVLPPVAVDISREAWLGRLLEARERARAKEKDGLCPNDVFPAENIEATFGDGSTDLLLDGAELLARFAALIDRICDDGASLRLQALEALLAKRGSRTLAEAVRARLDGGLREGNFFRRDMYAGLLAAMIGPDAIPDLLAAAAAELLDDQDSLQGTLWRLYDAYPEECRFHALAFARSTDASRQRAGVHALTFLPAREDDARDVLVAALAHGDEETRLEAVRMVAGSAWGALASIAAVLEQLAERDPSSRIRDAARRSK